MEQGRPARCVELDPFKPTFLKRDAHSLCELQASQPRLEVGSNEAPRRQPTCHLVQVLIGSPRPERGFLKLCAVCAFFFSVPSQGKRTEFFCCYPSVHLDTFLQNDGDSIFSPILFLSKDRRCQHTIQVHTGQPLLVQQSNFVTALPKGFQFLSRQPLQTRQNFLGLGQKRRKPVTRKAVGVHLHFLGR